MENNDSLDSEEEDSPVEEEQKNNIFTTLFKEHMRKYLETSDQIKK